MSYNYQSNGACTQTCKGYAFAVVQGKSCWCSNFAPADTTSTTSCNAPCPGFPYDQCGDQSAGLYGYISLGTPSGTVGANSNNNAATSTLQSSSNNNNPAVSDPESRSRHFHRFPLQLLFDSHCSRRSRVIGDQSGVLTSVNRILHLKGL